MQSCRQVFLSQVRVTTNHHLLTWNAALLRRIGFYETAIDRQVLMDARTAARLLRHDLPSQVACNNVANIASFARRFEGCFARSIVFHHNGRSFCIDLVKRSPIWIESRDSNVPVVRLIGSRAMLPSRSITT